MVFYRGSWHLQQLIAGYGSFLRMVRRTLRGLAAVEVVSILEIEGLEIEGFPKSRAGRGLAILGNSPLEEPKHFEILL